MEQVKTKISSFNSILKNIVYNYNIYIIFGIYILYCAFFPLERMLNTDCSYQLFNCINNETFFFQEYRYGVVLTQIPLLLGVFMKLPMLVLIMIYSLTFPIIYLIIALVCDKIFGCKSAALCCIISLISGVAFSFFHSTTETHLLIVLSCLLYAALVSDKKLSNPFYFHLIIRFVKFYRNSNT